MAAAQPAQKNLRRDWVTEVPAGGRQADEFPANRSSRIPARFPPAARRPLTSSSAPLPPELSGRALRVSLETRRRSPAAPADSVRSANPHSPAQRASCPNAWEGIHKIPAEILRLRRRRREFPGQIHAARPGERRAQSARGNSPSRPTEWSFRAVGGPDDLFIPARVITLRKSQRNVPADHAVKRAALRENSHVDVDHEISDQQQRRPRMHDNRNVSHPTQAPWQRFRKPQHYPGSQQENRPDKETPEEQFLPGVIAARRRHIVVFVTNVVGKSLPPRGIHGVEIHLAGPQREHV